MGKKKRKPMETAIDKQMRMAGVEEDMLAGMTRPGPLAVRYKVSASTIWGYMKEIQAKWREEDGSRKVGQKRRLRIGQLEAIFVRAIQDYIRSQVVEGVCKRCKGTGWEAEDWCRACDGEGRVQLRKPGDPAYLEAARKTLADIAKLEGLEPPKKKQVNKRSVSVVVDARRNGDRWKDVDDDELLRIMSAIRRLENGGKVIDVESEEKEGEP
jgi:hypothetical protein